MLYSIIVLQKSKEAFLFRTGMHLFNCEQESWDEGTKLSSLLLVEIGHVQDFVANGT